LVVLAPVMIASAIVIKMTLGSPVIYVHRRIGKNGRSFLCYKFRTMVNNADEILKRHLQTHTGCAREWEHRCKLARDPRVVGVGHILRQSSIDELPQLINVLRGEMSCVGPRPVVAAELARYGHYARDVISVRPGLTGLWQVRGRNRLDYSERIKLDRFYVRKRSFIFDIAILLRTIPALMRFYETE